MSWNFPWTAHLGLRSPEAPLFANLAKSTDPMDQIDCIADLGFAGVQDNFASMRPADEQQRIGDHAQRRGLAMVSFVHDPLGWNLPHWSVSDVAGRAALAKEMDQTLATAARIGSRRVTCVTGLDAARPRDVQRGAMAENLRAMGDRAARAGVVLCVESTCAARLPNMLLDSLDDALDVVRQADHPAVRIMFDVGHVVMSGDDASAAFDRAGDLIAAVQFADVDAMNARRRVDVGGGTIAWAPLLQRIAVRGDLGPIELEFEAEGAGADGERQMIERLKRVDAAL